MKAQDACWTEIVRVQDWYFLLIIYAFFTIPKPISERLSISMQFTDTHTPTRPQPHQLAAFSLPLKELKLKLSLETRNCGNVVVVHCHGRIVYREEAAALARLVTEVLEQDGKVVLDLSGVSSIDSAGIGELVSLHSQARTQNAEMKYASPSPLVRELLDLTNLDSILEIHPSVNEALAAFHPAEVGVDC